MAISGINKVILVGRLGQDPEVRMGQNGMAMTNFGLATSESWQDKMTGEKRERTEWHRVSIFGKLAEIAGQYLKKGSLVYIEGSLQTRKWQDQSGQERYTTEIVLNPFSGVMQMLGGRQEQNDYMQGAPASASNYGNSAHNANRPANQFNPSFNQPFNQQAPASTSSMPPAGDPFSMPKQAPMSNDSFVSPEPLEKGIDVHDDDVPF